MFKHAGVVVLVLIFVNLAGCTWQMQDEDGKNSSYGLSMASPARENQGNAQAQITREVAKSIADRSKACIDMTKAKEKVLADLLEENRKLELDDEDRSTLKRLEQDIRIVGGKNEARHAQLMAEREAFRKSRRNDERIAALDILYKDKSGAAFDDLQLILTGYGGAYGSPPVFSRLAVGGGVGAIGSRTGLGATRLFHEEGPGPDTTILGLVPGGYGSESFKIPLENNTKRDVLFNIHEAGDSTQYLWLLVGHGQSRAVYAYRQGRFGWSGFDPETGKRIGIERDEAFRR